MLVPLIIILLLSNYILAYDGEPRLYYDLKEADDFFSWFIEKYNKTYTKYEAKTRFQIFKQNLKKVNGNNSGLSSPVFGITQFTDLTSEEFIQKYTGFRLDNNSVNPNAIMGKDVQTLGDVPEAFDWRDQNVVTSVKSQEHCGACWAFAATGSSEAAHAKKTGKLVDLSPQQLVDCDQQSHGCKGGFPSKAWRSIIELGGQEKEIDYSYTATQGQCAFDNSKVEAVLTDYKSYQIQDEEQGKEILYQEGPLTIVVDASHFHQYNGGIMQNCEYNQLNHAVLLVGYGSENGVDYWIIKNSWGETFGEQGYIRLQRGVNSCGLTQYYFEHAVA